jgi:hypothetical protein
MPRVACWGSPRLLGFLQTSGTAPTSGPGLEKTTQISKGGKSQIRKFVKNYPQIAYLQISLVFQSANCKSTNLQGRKQCF